MSTVNAIFSGDLTDTADVAAAVAVSSLPVIYLTFEGAGYVRLTVQVYATAANAVISEDSPVFKSGGNYQWTPEVFKSPFNEVIVTTTAVGVTTGVKVDLCEV